METMNITEGNKLIAEFIGIPKQLHLYENPITGEYEEDLKYDSSWDWLMPVVEKIDKIQSQQECKEIISLGAEMWHKSFNKTEATYKAVIEFIKWYNHA